MTIGVYWSPPSRGRRELIPALEIDDVLQRPAGFIPLDLLRHVFRDRVGVGVGGVVRGKPHLWMAPERAVRRQRLGLEYVQRRRAKRAVVQAVQQLRLVLQPAAAGIDQHRRAERAGSI